jgi:hypothetical protein
MVLPTNDANISFRYTAATVHREHFTIMDREIVIQGTPSVVRHDKLLIPAGILGLSEKFLQ